MTEPFVQSNFERIPGDFYPTIDERCVDAFLQHFQPHFVTDPCSPDGSGIVDTFIKRGYNAVGLVDAFCDFTTDWIITNPPYDRKIVDKIINRQIERVERREVTAMAVLLRSGFDFAKSRAAMFDHPMYYGQIKLRFRPWWSENREAQPIHSYVWQIWHKDTVGYPRVMYASGTQ